MIQEDISILEKKIISTYFSNLGKLSAEKRKTLGHDSSYYRKLAQKRHNKKHDSPTSVQKSGEGSKV